MFLKINGKLIPVADIVDVERCEPPPDLGEQNHTIISYKTYETSFDEVKTILVSTIELRGAEERVFLKWLEENTKDIDFWADFERASEERQNLEYAEFVKKYPQYASIPF